MQNKNTEIIESPEVREHNSAPLPEHINACAHRVEINQDGDECVVTLLLNSPDSGLIQEAVRSISGLEDAFSYAIKDGTLSLSRRMFMPNGMDSSAIAYTISTLEAAADLITITCGFLQMGG